MTVFLVVIAGWIVLACALGPIVGHWLADRGGPPGRHRPGNVATDRAPERAA